MKKIIIKGLIYLAVLGAGIWIGNQGIKMLWGEAESNLKKSKIINVADKTTSVTGIEINDFSKLEVASYQSEKGENISSSEISFNNLFLSSSLDPVY